ncbi:histidine phosphatase family protein [Clostridium sp. D2Q-14]|uniref:histidine phosphatase family protein n=1 Tax=Anaeromonas gelatinilytica TaxID=2683194 RepID=UPI00193AF68C|nr:histidine phosphatase family protein [Anaeromonas gelatinilytica]
MGILIVVRHGETQFNVEKRYTGSLNIELNSTGFKQAKNLAKELRKYDIDVIITSTLKRAKQTTEIINNELKLPIIEMKEFCERNVGVFEGLT